MNELQVFENELFGEIRVGMINNEPWFVGKDVVEKLGYDTTVNSYTKYIKRYVDKEDVINYNEKTQVHYGLELDYKELGQRGGLLINEYGLYDLVLVAPLPQAKEFKRWITHEVLPQIRQTGGYIPLSKEDDEAEIMAKALLIAQKTIDKKDKLIERLQPKANWFDDFMNSSGTYTSTQVAKVFKISSARKLNQILNERGIIFKQGKNWLPYSTTNKEWFKVIVGENDSYSYSQLKFTPKGIIELSKVLEIDLQEEDLGSLSSNTISNELPIHNLRNDGMPF